MPGRVIVGRGRGVGFMSGMSETGSGHGEEVHINAIGTRDNGALISMASPLFTGALKAFEVEPFSGNPEHIEEFHRKWTLYLRMLQEGVGSALPDAMVLGHLRMKLDEGNRAILDADFAMNPGLTYYGFYEAFLERNRKDAQTTHHFNWRQVKLHMSGPPGKQLTKQDWEKFRANYILKRSMVEGWSEVTDYEQVFGQLPEFFQQAVVREQSKRRSGKYWVRVSIPKGFEMLTLLQEFEGEAECELSVVRSNGTHFVLECPTPQIASKLFAMDACSLNGNSIWIQKAESSMVSDEFFELVDRILKEESELRGLQQTCGTASRGPRKSDIGEVQFRPVNPPPSKTPSDNSGRNYWQNYGGRGKGNYNSQPANSQPKDSGPVKGGKSKGKGKSGKASGGGDATPQNSTPQNAKSQSQCCYECRNNGREYMHDFRKCKFWIEQKAKKAGAVPVTESQPRPPTPPRPRPEEVAVSSNTQ